MPLAHPGRTGSGLYARGLPAARLSLRLLGLPLTPPLPSRGPRPGGPLQTEGPPLLQLRHLWAGCWGRGEVRRYRGFGEVSGAYRLVLFIQLEVAHKHFRLARPTESAQGGGSNRAC